MATVELYYLCLSKDGFDGDLSQALALLDEHERARYRRFKNDHAQACFLQARRIAKTTLAQKLACDAGAIRFAYTDTEKPYLVGDANWHFNISHSHSMVVVALAQAPVGVDVEDIDRCRSLWPKAASFLNAYVQRCVDACDSSEAAAAMFAEHWCCTESYIKLKGSAIYRDKDRVESRAVASFDGGTYYRFEDVALTVLNGFPESRLCVAQEERFAAIELINWQGGSRQRFPA